MRLWFRLIGFTVCALVVATPLRAQEIVAPAVRNVTPPGITPGPAGEGPLVREAVPPSPPEPARWRRYFLPVTTDAATFVIDGKLTIRVSGVTPPAPGEVCADPEGGSWPCGQTSLYSLRMYLRGRAIECYFPDPGDALEVVAPCRVGASDLGAWLLSAGWARPDDLATNDYLAASANAHCAGVGIWRGTARPDYCPEPPPPAANTAAGAGSGPWLPQ
jgi:endonuclease YncB( thermonuclease family)